MSWSNAARQSGWARAEDLRPRSRQGWTPTDIAVLVLAFYLRWEIGLAFLALKLWHQASGFEGGVFSFAKVKWEALVAYASGLSGAQSLPFSVRFAPKSSGNVAFDAWRRAELERIETERRKLQAAERDFMVYREELMHPRDQEAFERFMRGRAS